MDQYFASLSISEIIFQTLSIGADILRLTLTSSKGAAFAEDPALASSCTSSLDLFCGYRQYNPSHSMPTQRDDQMPLDRSVHADPTRMTLFVTSERRDLTIGLAENSHRHP